MNPSPAASPCLPAQPGHARPYHGSALLASCWARVGQTALIVVLLWALAGWALQWW